MTSGTCRFCEQPRNLEISHIIPKFVFRWQEKTAISAMRETERPNLRVQDGTKIAFLCSDCEDRFGKWETSFAREVFEPLHRDHAAIPSSVTYGSWCLKFAVSVSWRVLKYWSEDSRFASLDNKKRNIAFAALTAWRDFLLERRSHPAQFEQHVLPLNGVEHTTIAVSPAINRYLLRAVDHCFVHSSEIMYVYSKLGRFALFGMIPPDAQVPGWKNTRLAVKRGVLSLRDTWVEIPEEIMRFVSDRADHASQALRQMSPRQKQKVQTAINSAIAAQPDAEVFRALLKDYELFGEAALSPTTDDEARNA